jgi:ribosome maturation factor RimP
MDATARIAELIAPALAAMGFDLVRVRLSGAKRLVLQVMAERSDGTMSIEDCSEASRVISAILDVEDPITSAYTLEVSSPGIDRPLVRAADYERFAGFEARLETAAPIDGQRRFRGRLLGLDDQIVRIALDEGEIGIPFAAIATGKLVLTDDLIAASLKQSKNSKPEI